VARPARIISIHYYLFAILLLTVAAGVYFDRLSLPDIAIGKWNLSSIGAGFLTFLAFLFLVAAEIKRLRKKYIIAHDTVERRDGILRRRTNLMPYNKVERVELDQSILDRILGIGDVIIDTGEDIIVLQAVKNPSKIQETLSKRLRRPV